MSIHPGTPAHLMLRSIFIILCGEPEPSFKCQSVNIVLMHTFMYSV